MSLFEFIIVAFATSLGSAVMWVIGASILVTQRKRAFSAVRQMLRDPQNKGKILYRDGKNGSFMMSVRRRKVKDEYRQFALVMHTINNYWFGTGKNIRDFGEKHWDF